MHNPFKRNRSWVPDTVIPFMSSASKGMDRKPVDGFTHGEIAALLANVFEVDNDRICGYALVIMLHPEHRIQVIAPGDPDHIASFLLAAGRKMFKESQHER